MTYQEMLQQKLNELNEICEALNNDTLSSSDRFRKMKEEALRFRDLLQAYIADPYRMTEEQKSDFVNVFADMAQDADLYVSAHGTAHLHEYRRVRAGNADRLSKLADELRPLVHDANNASLQAETFMHSFLQDKEEKNIAGLDDFLTSADTKVRPEDCFLKGSERYAGDLRFGKLLNLAVLDQASRNSAEPDMEEKTMYQKAFKDSLAELKDAPSGDQMAVALKILRYRTALTDRMYSAYQKYARDEAEGRGSAAVRLYNDPNYRKLEGLKLLEGALGNTSGKFIEHMEDTMVMKTRTSVRQMKNLMPGKLVLTEEQRTAAQASRRRIEKNELDASCYKRIPHELEGLFTLYGRMAEDPESASSSYRAMRESLGNFLAMDHNHVENTSAYESVMSHAMRCAERYSDTHRGYRISDNGKQRQSQAISISAVLGGRLNALHQRMQENRAAFNQYNQNVNEDMIRLGLMNNLTSAKFIPKEKQKNPDHSRARKVLNSVLHALSNAVVRSVQFFTKAPMKRYRNRMAARAAEADQADFTRIPGLYTGESFEKFDPDTKPADQEVLSDTRRAPLVWERSIPEDPNQEPKITIYTKQAVEGKARASTHSGSVGHAFISLEYTRKDPLSGEPKRYRSTFGFYPRGLDDHDMLAATVGVNGGEVPGMLVDDSESHSHAGITYNATNRQINKILIAAQKYAEGGYNMTSRNCATFAKDMAEVAGIDVSDLFRQTDFEIGAKFATANAIGQPFADLFRMYGNHALHKGMDRPEYTDYQLLGQSEVSEQNIRHFNRGEGNMRLKGYNPSRVAEAIKRSGKNIAATQSLNLEEEFSEDARQLGTFYNAKMEAALNDIKAKISTTALEHPEYNINAEEMNRRLQEYYVQYYGIGDDLNNGRSMKLPEGTTQYTQYKYNERCLKSAYKDLKDYQNTVDQFYKNVLHSDPDMYKEFQHFSSVLEFAKKKAAERLHKLDSKYAEKTKSFGPEHDLKRMIDDNCENIGGVDTYRFGSVDVAHHRYTIPVYLASAMVYADGKHSMFDDTSENARLNRIENPSKAEKQQKAEAVSRLLMCENAAQSFAYYTGAPSFTKSEIDFLFTKVGAYAQMEGNADAARAIQSFAWNHVMSPCKTGIDEAISRTAGGLKEQLTNLKANEQAVKENVRNLSADICKVISGSMNTDHPEFKMIMNAMKQAQERQLMNQIDSEQARRQLEDYSIECTLNEVVSSLMTTRFNDRIERSTEQAVAGMELDQDTKDRFMKMIKNQVTRDLTASLNVAMRIQKEDYKMNLEPDMKAEQRLHSVAADFLPACKMIEETPCHTKAFEAALPVFEPGYAAVRALDGKEHKTPQDKARLRGLENVMMNGTVAMKDLACDAAAGTRYMTKNDKQMLLKNLASAAFVPFMNKLNPANRDAVLEKIGTDRHAYDKYVNHLMKSERFRKIFTGNGSMKLSSLTTKEGVAEMMNRLDTAFTRDFYRSLGESNLKHHAPEHAAQAPQAQHVELVPVH